MSRKYLLPIILFLGLGIILLILPPKNTHEKNTPEELLRQVNSPSRFITPDEVAARIIEKDPSLLLIDVRSFDDYLNYTLPGAINIPLSELADSTQLELLKQEGIDYVLFSNGSIISDQAWILGQRLGLQHLYVMKGGINLWFDNFYMNPAPLESQPVAEQELYQFRMGVRQYFTGGDVEIAQPNSPEIIQVQQKVKKSAAEGGC